MIKFNRIFLLFLIFSFSNVHAEVFYIDLDKIMNQSKPGIYINNIINDLQKQNQETVSKKREDLKKREEKLINQKNILSNEEFNIKLNELKSDVNQFNKDNQVTRQENQKKLINYKTTLLKMIEPILLEYVNQNNIKYLLQKKYIIVGHNDFNKTNEIIDIVNQKIDVSKLND